MTLIPSNCSYALVLESPRHLVIEHGAGLEPLAAGEALVESRFVAVCGTDLEVIDGASDRAQPPLVLGHEWAGRVAATGPMVDPMLVGKFVVGDNFVPCGACEPCQRGVTYKCRNGAEIGFELPGAFASHFRIPARNLYPLPDLLHGPTACFIEPLAVSVRAVRAAHIHAGDSVLVLGDGVVGLLLARLASFSGARVVMLVGKHDDRLQIASRLGIHRVSLEADFNSGNAGNRTDWSVVFEASGNPNAIGTAIEAAGNEARVILAGDYGTAPVPLAATAVVRKELHVVGTNASSGAWAEAVDLAKNLAVDLSVVTQLVLPFAQWPEALQAARDRRAPRVVLQHHTAEAAV